jgi:hypothetical protein
MALAGFALAELGMALFGNDGQPNHAKASCVADVAINTVVKSTITNEQSSNVKNRIEYKLKADRNKGFLVFATQCNTAIITSSSIVSQKDTTTGRQDSHISSTIDQTAQALAEGAASGALADTSTAIKEVLDTCMSMREDDTVECDQDDDISFVMNASDNDGTLAVGAKQNNYATINSTVACMQSNIQKSIQRSSTESDITQKADSKAKGASFGDLFSGIFGAVGVIIVIAVVASVGFLGVEWIRVCLLAGFIGLYVLCAAMAILKYFGTGADDDAADSVKSCERNKQKYEGASHKYILSAPFYFRVSHPGTATGPATPAGYTQLKGSDGKQVTEQCSADKVEETMHKQWAHMPPHSPPIVGIWCRESPYETDVISDWTDWDDLKVETVKWQQFFILQQVKLSKQPSGTLYFFVADTANYPSKDISVYAWCTGNQKPGLAAVKPQYPVFSRPGQPGGGDDGNGGYNVDPNKNQPFSYLPYPLPKCAENGFAKEQSINVMCTQTKQPIPPTQNDDDSESTCSSQKDKVMLPNTVLKLEALGIIANEKAAVSTYAGKLSQYTDLVDNNNTVYLGIPNTAEIATWDDRNDPGGKGTRPKGGSCFPAWIFETEAVTQGAGFAQYSNTVLYGFVEDRNEYQPVGPNPEHCVTYGEAMDAKKWRCLVQIIVYLTVLLVVLVLQLMFTAQGLFGLLDVTFAVSCGTMAAVGAFLAWCGYEGYEMVKSER